MAGVYVLRSAIAPGLMSEQDLVELTSSSATSTVVDEDVVDFIVAEAEAEVDGYLGTRHALPLATVPPMVKSLAARITRYRLRLRKDGTVSEQMEKDYQSAIKLLENIRDGKVTLGAQPEAAPNTETVIRTKAGSPVFGRSNLSGF